MEQEAQEEEANAYAAIAWEEGARARKIQTANTVGNFIVSSSERAGETILLITPLNNTSYLVEIACLFRTSSVLCCCPTV